jgi:hypothetical protein
VQISWGTISVVYLIITLYNSVSAASLSMQRKFCWNYAGLVLAVNKLPGMSSPTLQRHKYNRRTQIMMIDVKTH